MPASLPRSFGRFGIVLAVSLAGLVFAASVVQATSEPAPATPTATITVDTTTDEFGVGLAACSLREAIQSANTNSAFGGCTAGAAGADIINLPAGTYTLTISGTGEDLNATGDLDVVTDTDGLILNGMGATSATVVINANGIDRVLHAPSGPVTLTNLTMYNGNVTGSGGGAYLLSAAYIANTTFFSNTATSSGGGGGVYLLGAAYIANTTFFGNTATSIGGGATFGGAATVTGTTFLSNTASIFGGGAFFNSAVTMTGTTFTGNTATDGGGAYFDDTATMTGTTFTGNTATNGGGAFFYNDVATATVTGTTFLSNTAANSGGGATFSGAATVTSTTFLGNTAANSGGGAIFGGTATVTGTTFIGNTATDGGGVHFFGTGIATGDFVNTLFAANRASRGAGLYARNNGGDNVVTLRHATIASPTVGSSSAVYVLSGTVNITNTIVASYSVGLERAGGLLNENYTLFSDVATPYSGTVTSGGPPASITGTAAFADTTLYRLTSASTAIDAGTNVSVTSDFEGDVRPFGGGFDIGYDELPYFITYTITPTAGANGSIAPDTPQTVSHGDDITFTIAADTGYYIVDVGVDGVPQGVVSSYTFTNVVANHTLTATFALDVYTLTIATAGNGSGVVSPTVGAHPYTIGTVVTLTATANLASLFVGWSGDADCADGVVILNMNLACTATFNTYKLFLPIILR